MSETVSTEQPTTSQAETAEFGAAFQGFYLELKKQLDLTFAGLSELDQEEDELLAQIKGQIDEKKTLNAQLEKKIESINAVISRYVNALNATNQD